MLKHFKYIKVFSIILLILISFLVMGCTSPSTKKDQDAEKAKLEKLRATKKYKELKIEIGDNYFSPKEVTVDANTIVIWTNKGSNLHDVMWDNRPMSDHKTTSDGDLVPNDDEVDFTSKTLKTGDIHVTLFTYPGKFPYHCHFHGGPKRGQWGEITVVVK